jgi:predicted transcriptional regulator of viral defense system
MNWQAFRTAFFPLGCVELNQILAWSPGFDRNNLHRWSRKGYLVRLRRGMYAFPEFKRVAGAAASFAGRMYRPSYISLHTALSNYGLIPEAIVQITSVTTLKTAAFKNNFGEFSYKSVRCDLMFGYAPRAVGEGLFALQATIEKALVDLLYLYPSYDTEAELAELRLDEHLLRHDVDWKLLGDYLGRVGSLALASRFKRLRKAYGL